MDKILKNLLMLCLGVILIISIAVNISLITAILKKYTGTKIIARELSSSYTTEIMLKTDEAKRWRLIKNTDYGDRVVGEAILRNESIISIMPTPVYCPCLGEPLDDGYFIKASIDCITGAPTVTLNGYDEPEGSSIPRSFDYNGTRMNLAEAVAAVKNEIASLDYKGPVMLKVEPPIAYSHWQKCMEAFAGLENGFVISCAEQDPWNIDKSVEVKMEFQSGKQQ